MDVHDHKVWYIINEETGHVITSQWKAYMDQIRMLMYLDLIIKTPILQICDLVVNVPIKRHTKTARIRHTYRAFQAFLADYEQMTQEQKRHAKFKPPKPELVDGLKELFRMFDEGGEFTQPAFEDGVKRSFRDTGSAPMEEGKLEFVEYKESPNLKRGQSIDLPVTPLGVKKEYLYGDEDELDLVQTAIDAYLENDDYDVPNDFDDFDDEDDYAEEEDEEEQEDGLCCGAWLKRGSECTAPVTPGCPNYACARGGHCQQGDTRNCNVHKN
jgi:hypothetical protein